MKKPQAIKQSNERGYNKKDTKNNFKKKMKTIASFIEKYPTFSNVIINVILIILAFFLWVETRRQVIVSRDAVKVSIATLRFQRESDSLNTISQKEIVDSSYARNKRMADNSYVLSKRIAETQERASIIDARAYICVDTMKIHPIVIGKIMKVDIFSINTGRTPANHLIARLDAKFGGTGVYKTDIQRFENELNDSTKYMPLAPGMSKYLEFPIKNITITNDIYNAIIIHGEPVYFIGMITYIDLFGGNDTTRFCYKYTISDGVIIWSTYNEVK
jgi:hypothetical protein